MKRCNKMTDFIRINNGLPNKMYANVSILYGYTLYEYYILFVYLLNKMITLLFCYQINIIHTLFLNNKYNKLKHNI